MKLENVIYLIKVRLDEAAMQKVPLEDGNLISKEDFIKISQDLKLLDFGGPMGEKRKTNPRKDKRSGDTEAVNVSFDLNAKSSDFLYFLFQKFCWFIIILFY